MIDKKSFRIIQLELSLKSLIEQHKNVALILDVDIVKSLASLIEFYASRASESCPDLKKEILKSIEDKLLNSGISDFDE